MDKLQTRLQAMFAEHSNRSGLDPAFSKKSLLSTNNPIIHKLLPILICLLLLHSGYAYADGDNPCMDDCIQSTIPYGGENGYKLRKSLSDNQYRLLCQTVCTACGGIYKNYKTDSCWSTFGKPMEEDIDACAQKWGSDVRDKCRERFEAEYAPELKALEVCRHKVENSLLACVNPILTQAVEEYKIIRTLDECAHKCETDHPIDIDDRRACILKCGWKKDSKVVRAISECAHQCDKTHPGNIDARRACILNCGWPKE